MDKGQDGDNKETLQMTNNHNLRSTAMQKKDDHGILINQQLPSTCLRALEAKTTIQKLCTA